jgi:hypothetical protein
MKDANSGDMPMTIDSVCTRNEAPIYKEVALSTPGAFDGRQSYRLTDLGNNRTRLEIDGRFHYSMWFAQLMEPLITPEARKKMDGDLAHLKSLVESTPTSAAR